MPGKQRFTGFRRNVLSSLLLLALAANAAVATADAQEPMTGFNIAGQPAATGLNAFAEQADITLVFSQDSVSGIDTRPLIGSYSIAEGLDRMLEGTGLSYQLTGDNTVAISAERSGETASTAPAGVMELGAVVVTGTRIRGATTPSPIIEIDQEQIREEGYADLGEVIRSIPQNFSGGQNPGVALGSGGIVNQNMNSGSALNLRGLGPDATLTLLNGRRLSYSGFVNAVDVSVVPIAALDRIEVIADGASAIYGSDAVAGVANIITKRDFDGVSATYRTGTSADGGGSERQFSLVAGTTWQSGGLIAAYDHTHVDAVYGHQRSFTGYMLAPNSILPERAQRSGLISGYQELGESALLSVDALYTDRDSLTTANQPTQRLIYKPQTLIFAISPNLEIYLPGDWTLTFGGSYGNDKTLYRQALVPKIPGGAPLRFSRGCYCNASVLAEIGAEGPIFTLPGGESRIAVGAGYRKNDFESRSFTAGRLTEGKRSSRYAYGEILLPLVAPEQGVAAIHRLEATAAFRHEDYGDMGKVTTPKLGLIYQPSADFSLKGSWGKSYKAPNLLQQYQEYSTYLWTAAALGAEGYPADATALMVYGGNSDLKPERAESWTGSVLFHPEAVPGLQIELSYFDIDYRDRVVQPIENFGATFRDAAYQEFLTFSPTPEQQAEAIAPAGGIDNNFTPGAYDPAKVIAIVHDQYVNVARQRVSGVDLSGSYGFDFVGGRMTVRGSASWLDGHQQNSASQPEFDTAGMIFNAPKFRGRAGVVWSDQHLMLSSFVSHVGGVTDNQRPMTAELGSFTTVDLNARYDVGERGGMFSNMEFALSIQNLLDEPPPLFVPITDYTVNYDSTNYSALGRFISLSITKRW